MRRTLHEDGLTLFFGALFLLSLLGQAVAGYLAHNDKQVGDSASPSSLLAYLASSDYAVDVAENWQSEYLQFVVFVFATIWFVQRGSTESKVPGGEGPESDEEQGVREHAGDDSPAWAGASGPRLWLLSNSLGIVMGLLFLGSWLAQAVAGRAAYNAQQLHQHQDPVGLGGYVASPDFWDRTLQNWQSEFLAILSMIVLSVYLRQRGSPQSKPVGAAHGDTADEG